MTGETSASEIKTEISRNNLKNIIILTAKFTTLPNLKLQQTLDYHIPIYKGVKLEVVPGQLQFY